MDEWEPAHADLPAHASVAQHRHCASYLCFCLAAYGLARGSGVLHETHVAVREIHLCTHTPGSMCVGQEVELIGAVLSAMYCLRCLLLYSLSDAIVNVSNLKVAKSCQSNVLLTMLNELSCKP